MELIRLDSGCCPYLREFLAVAANAVWVRRRFVHPPTGFPDD